MDEEMEKVSFYINFPFDESLFFYRANLQTLFIFTEKLFHRDYHFFSSFLIFKIQRRYKDLLADR